MDAVAEAAGKDVEKPPFYYAEQSQQKQFNCSACGEFNDVLGRFVYCTVCGTRNDLDELENKIVPTIRADLKLDPLLYLDVLQFDYIPTSSRQMRWRGEI